MRNIYSTHTLYNQLKVRIKCNSEIISDYNLIIWRVPLSEL